MGVLLCKRTPSSESAENMTSRQIFRKNGAAAAGALQLKDQRDHEDHHADGGDEEEIS